MCASQTVKILIAFLYIHLLMVHLNCPLLRQTLKLFLFSSLMDFYSKLQNSQHVTDSIRIFMSKDSKSRMIGWLKRDEQFGL